MWRQRTVGDMPSMIAMPVCVLTTRGSVKIQDSVDVILSTEIDDAIKVLEARLLEDPRVHVIFTKSNCQRSSDIDMGAHLRSGDS